MAGEIIRPSALPDRPNPVASEKVPTDNGVTVGGTTWEAGVNAGRPVASQFEAEAGVNPTKAMTPLTTKQAVTARIGVDIASKAQGDKADSALQSVVGSSDIDVDDTDPQNPVITYTGAGVSDGDKGAVTVSAGGAAWGLNSGVVGRPNLAPALAQSVSVNVAEYGAVGDGIADDTVAVNAAIAAAGEGGEILLPVGKVYSVTSVTNPFGVTFLGSGRIVIASSGKPVSFNELDYGREVVAAHNLISWHASLAGAPGTANIVLHGDSNTEGSPVWLADTRSFPQELLKRAARLRGFSVQVTNYGVGGTNIDDFDPSAWIGDTTKTLLVLSYGTNGAGLGADHYRSELRSALTLVRATRPFDLGIVLFSPPTGTDTFAPNGTLHGRDEVWARKVHEINLEMVEEFNVCVVDRFTAYWRMRTTYGGAHMDTLSTYDPVNYRTDAHIHARDILNAKMWTDILGPVLFPDSVGIYRKNNASVYLTSIDTDFVPIPASAPGDYPFGRTLKNVTTATGWPLDGVLLNDRHPDGSQQILFGNDISATRSGTATYSNRWHFLSPAGSAYTFGPNVTWASGGTSVGKTGDVGAIYNYLEITGNIAVNQLLFTVPAMYRPSLPQVVALITGSGTGAALLQTDGQMIAKSAHTSPGFFSVSPWLIL